MSSIAPHSKPRFPAQSFKVGLEWCKLIGLMLAVTLQLSAIDPWRHQFIKVPTPPGVNSRWKPIISHLSSPSSTPVASAHSSTHLYWSQTRRSLGSGTKLKQRLLVKGTLLLNPCFVVRQCRVTVRESGPWDEIRRIRRDETMNTQRRSSPRTVCLCHEPVAHYSLSKAWVCRESLEKPAGWTQQGDFSVSSSAFEP